MNDLLPRQGLRQQVALTCATLLAVALLLFARKPDALLHARFFAEDAVIFFNQDRTYGVGALFMPYAGYHHLLVRCVAYLAGLLDPLYAPLIYASAALLAGVATAGVCLAAKHDLSLPCRITMALSVALVPHGGEAYLILTNIQWILGPALLLLALQQPPTMWWAQLGCLLLLAAGGLTGPFLAIFTPIVLLKIALEKDWSPYRLGALGIAAAAALVQFHQLAGRDGAKVAAKASAWVVAPAEHVISKFAFGPSLVLDPAVYPWVYLAAALLGLVFLCWRAVRTSRLIVVYLLFGALLLLMAGYYILRNAPYDLDPFDGANRYTFQPYLLITWVIIIYGFESTRWRVARFIVALVLVGVVISALTRFQIQLSPNNWPLYLAEYQRGERKEIPIDPPSWQFGLAKAATP